MHLPALPVAALLIVMLTACGIPARDPQPAPVRPTAAQSATADPLAQVLAAIAAEPPPAQSAGQGRAGAPAAGEPPLYPNETPELRRLINRYADLYGVPRSLVHAAASKESTHRPWARNGPNLGLL